MEEYKLGEQETRFAELIWDNAPITSPDLVKLAAEVMEWKKSTTYTMLRRLCKRGIFKNENATVDVVQTRDQFYAGQSRKYVEDTFGGSLPRFIASSLIFTAEIFESLMTPSDSFSTCNIFSSVSFTRCTILQYNYLHSRVHKSGITVN